MASEVYILSSESTCATCSIDDIFEFDTGNTEMGDIISIKESDFLKYELLMERNAECEDAPNTRFSTSYLSLLSASFLQIVPADDYFEIMESLEPILLMNKSSATSNQHILTMKRYLDLAQSPTKSDKVAITKSIARFFDEYRVRQLYTRSANLFQIRNQFVNQERIWDSIISYRATPFRSKVGYSYSDYVSISLETDHYLSKHHMLDHLISLAIKTIINRLYLQLDSYELSVLLWQDPECKTPDIRLSIESDSTDFDEITGLWEELSNKVEDVIWNIGQLNKMEKEEIEDVLDMFTISVIPQRD